MKFNILILGILLLSSCVRDHGNLDPKKTEAAKIAYNVVERDIYRSIVKMELMQKVDSYIDADSKYEKDSILFYVLKDYNILENDSTVNLNVSYNETTIDITRSNDASLYDLGAKWTVKYYNPADSYTEEGESILIENIGNNKWRYSSVSKLAKTEINIERTSDIVFTDDYINNTYKITEGSTSETEANTYDESVNVKYNITKAIETTNDSYSITICSGKIDMLITFASTYRSEDKVIKDEATAEILSKEEMIMRFRGVSETWDLY